MGRVQGAWGVVGRGVGTSRWVSGGADTVSLGSDYPFPLGDLEIGRFIEQMDLTDAQKQDIFSKAAIEWLNLDPNSLKQAEEA